MATEAAALWWGRVALPLASIQGCPFQPGSVGGGNCAVYMSIPLAQLTGGTSHTVFETPGTIIAIHGSGTATHAAGSSGGAIKVQQSVSLPVYSDQALVFLNGWKLDYVGDDHYVLALGSAITDIHFDPKLHTLTWTALGLIRDNDGKKGYDWTYQFTVVAWSNLNLSAFVDQGAFPQTLTSSNCTDELPDNYFYSTNSGTSDALSCFLSFLQNSSFAANAAVAVLPRGFGFTWNDSDHNLFQLAYNMDHSEVLADSRKYNKLGQQIPAPVPNPPATHVDSGFVSWSPYAIFEDNDNRRDYTFAEVVSGLGGNDVGVVQPPFSTLPTAADAPFLGIFSSCGEVGGQPTVTEQHVIENIPYQFAIPMLTGWNMRYLCSDQHVRHVGVWIDDWSYQPPSGASGGTLRYTLSSILDDNDSTRTHVVSDRVTVLGLRGAMGGGKNGTGGNGVTGSRGLVPRPPRC
jgi:hypothetical protein